MRLSDYIISRIYALGTDTLFSVSGRGILFLTDAVAKHKKINNIATHHEQAAGFSAVAYAQKSNKLGIHTTRQRANEIETDTGLSKRHTALRGHKGSGNLSAQTPPTLAADKFPLLATSPEKQKSCS